ncbi:hypothetical protein VP01_2066g4 [Puccinia sorghi]|uniref:C2H2-type domain-containing protein n=1 Tax=Puccinia sorghi TaxID=27349 RepID=A0A0L6VCF0_9BASI|nr:hypothetical protein VP01_2066g4 [Puccinia sorghi]
MPKSNRNNRSHAKSQRQRSTPERSFVCLVCTLQLPVLEAIKQHVRANHPNLYT